MTTLIDTVKPTESYLEDILPQALNGRSEEEYLTVYLDGMVERLKKNPQLYHLYGPWWPALKTLLLERGDISFGQVVDSDVAEIYKMSRPALTVLAGHLYSAIAWEMTRYTIPFMLWKSHLMLMIQSHTCT